MYNQQERQEGYDQQNDLIANEMPLFVHTEYAGFWLRFAALLIDGVIVTFAASILLGILGIQFMLLEDENEAMKGLLGFYGGLQVAVILYYGIMESSKMQATLGKRAVGIYVADQEGRRISFLRAIGRHFAKFLSGIILYIGFILAAFTERKQGLHDMIAGTLVVKGTPRG